MLIDVIRERGIVPPRYYVARGGNLKTWAAIEADMMQSITIAPVFQVQNVADYIYAQCGQDVWVLGRDFPYLMPPFPACWMETGRPPCLNNNGAKNPYPDRPLRWGALLRCIGIPEYVESDEARWMLRMDLIYLVDKQDPALYTGGGIAFSLDHQGVPVGVPYALCLGQPEMKADGMTDFDAWSSDVIARCYPFMLALSFLNCKNVTTTIQEMPKKVQVSRQRKSRLPLAKYYTLNIEPMKRVLRAEGRSEEVGLRRALHICRGHFASYSEDKPLFGKVSGRFWVSAHVRGSKDAGEINKDYKIKIDQQGGNASL